MKSIGLISDTHGFIHPSIYNFFRDVDEIWHAGDIGNTMVSDKLEAFKKCRMVYGNIDDHKLRIQYPEIQLFKIEDVGILMMHIGGYPGRYTPKARNLIESEKPDLFISGHSHILKVMNDQKYGLLHMNPGSAGKNGLHKKITMLRFQISANRFTNLEVFEADRVGQKA